jgi:predicted dehydrogenase
VAKKTPIRLAIVGLGRAGRYMHLGELENKKDRFRLVAACDLIEDRRKWAEQEYGCRAYRRFEDVLDDDEVEMVSIATRSCDHVEHALAALKAGKHVFLEKPIAETYQQALRLKRAAAKAKGKLFFRHNRRYEPCFNHVMQIIESGKLGEVFFVKIRRGGFQRRDDWQTLKRYGGGMLLNWGPHVIDHALHLLDSPVADLWSDLQNRLSGGNAEDNCHLVFRGRSGRVVDMEISSAYAIPEPVYIVQGDRGSLHADDETIRLRYLDPRKKLPVRKAKAGTPEKGFGSEDPLKWIEKEMPVSPKGKWEMDRIWIDLYEAVREGKPFPITMEQALAVMKVVSAAKAGTKFEKKSAQRASKKSAKRSR